MILAPTLAPRATPPATLHEPPLHAHFSTDFLKYCSRNHIELFCLLPHTMHILQPLDVALFGPLQSYYGQRIEDHLCLTGEAITKRNFLPYVIRLTGRLILRLMLILTYIVTSVKHAKVHTLLKTFCLPLNVLE